MFCVLLTLLESIWAVLREQQTPSHERSERPGYPTHEESPLQTVLAIDLSLTIAHAQRRLLPTGNLFMVKTVNKVSTSSCQIMRLVRYVGVQMYVLYNSRQKKQTNKTVTKRFPDNNKDINKDSHVSRRPTQYFYICIYILYMTICRQKWFRQQDKNGTYTRNMHLITMLFVSIN